MTNITTNTLKVASLNLGYNVMSNIVYGSESPFVQLSQKAHPKFRGWADASRQISAATLNSAMFLSDYDVFGLQEVNLEFGKTFESKLAQIGTSKGKNYQFVTGFYFGTFGITIGYDENKLGPGFQITPDVFQFGSHDPRALQAVYFPEVQLFFMNVHAPHNIDLPAELMKTFKKVETLFYDYFGDSQVKRVIMTGDFNDDNGSLINKTLKIFGLDIKIPGSKVPKTCCTDSGYQYVGDYILDSKSTVQFGLPMNYDRKIHLYSDHDPVVLIDTSFENGKSNFDDLYFETVRGDVVKASVIMDHPTKSRALFLSSQQCPGKSIDLGLVSEEELGQLVKILNLKKK